MGLFFAADLVVTWIRMASGKEKLRELLGREMRVEVTDGRIITGVFYCIDNNKNLILRDCIQEQVIPIPNVPENEWTKDNNAIGMVLIPGHHIVQCGVNRNLPPQPEDESPSTPTPKSL